MNPANMLAAQASTVVLAVAVSDIWIGLEDDTDSRNGTRRFWLFVHGGEARHNWLDARLGGFPTGGHCDASLELPKDTQRRHFNDQESGNAAQKDAAQP